MANILLVFTFVLSMLGLSAVSLYAGIKFLILWSKFREESLFHLGILFLEFIVYMVFVAFIILVSDNRETVNYLLKRFLGFI